MSLSKWIITAICSWRLLSSSSWVENPTTPTKPHALCAKSIYSMRSLCLCTFRVSILRLGSVWIENVYTDSNNLIQAMRHLLMLLLSWTYLLNIDNDVGNMAADRNHVFWNRLQGALYVENLPQLLTEMKYCLLFYRNHTPCKEVWRRRSCQHTVCDQIMNTTHNSWVTDSCFKH